MKRAWQSGMKLWQILLKELLSTPGQKRRKLCLDWSLKLTRPIWEEQTHCTTENSPEVLQMWPQNTFKLLQRSKSFKGGIFIIGGSFLKLIFTFRILPEFLDQDKTQSVVVCNSGRIGPIVEQMDQMFGLKFTLFDSYEDSFLNIP